MGAAILNFMTRYGCCYCYSLEVLLCETIGPFAASGHMVHAGGQAAHWDIQNKENSNLS